MNSGFVKKQNMLTPEASAHLLRTLKPVAVFSGHDHEGCFYLHDNTVPEYTVRSTMADYSGNSAFFEIRRRPGSRAEYDTAFSACPFRDHIWVKVVLIASMVCQLVSLLGLLLITLCCRSGGSEKEKIR